MAQHHKLLNLLSSLLPTSIPPEDRFDPRHFQRDRIFTVDFLTFTLLYLISDQNHFGYQHTLETLWKELRALEIVDQSATVPQKSSLCKARRKLPAKYIKDMFDRTVKLSNEFEPKRLWKGHRLFAMDGMKVELPASAELKQHFGCPTGNEGEAHYPQALVVVLFNVLTDEVYNLTLSPYATSEREQALVLLESLQAGDVVVDDRGFPSWELFWEHKKCGVDFVMRMPAESNWTVVRKFLASGKIDQCVTVPITENARTIYKNDPTVPKSLTLRLVRVTLKTGEVEVLVTSFLNRKKYSTKEIQEVYPQRWPIEEGNKSVKCHQVIENFHAKDVNGIFQEVNAHYLLMAITRLFMLQSSAVTSTPERYYGLSYKSAVDFVSNDLVTLLLIDNKNLKNKTMIEILEMISHLYEKPRYHRSYRRWSRRGRRKYQQRYANPPG